MSIYCTQDPKKIMNRHRPPSRNHEIHIIPQSLTFYLHPTHIAKKNTKVSSLSAMREEDDVRKPKLKAYSLHPHLNMRHGRQVLFIDGLGK